MTAEETRKQRQRNLEALGDWAHDLREEAPDAAALLAWARQEIEGQAGSVVIDRWIQAHEAEQGAYAALAGFEAALRAHGEVLATWYGEADLDEQLALFTWVTKLLEEEAKR